MFFQLRPEEVKFYSTANQFGDDVALAFPTASYDIEEAARCYATARYTACVLHLMRVLEVGLDALKTATGITSYNPTWNAALIQIEKALSGVAEKDKTPEQRDRDQFIRDAVYHLRSVKDAIRNPSIHKAEKFYTDEMSLEVFNAVRAFMRDIAIRLKE